LKSGVTNMTVPPVTDAIVQRALDGNSSQCANRAGIHIRLNG
jgi:hypothetical protein